MLFKNPYLTIKDKIELLEYWIIFQSYLYYEKDITIVSDNVYNNNAKQLIQYKNKYNKIFNNSKYYQYFKNFNSTSGYYIYSMIKKKKDNYLLNRIKYDYAFIQNKKNNFS